MSKLKILEICKKCKAHCCKLGDLTVTAKEMDKILKAGFPDHFIKVGKGRYDIKSENGRCPYLKKDYSCQIYEVRPKFCMIWPVNPEYSENGIGFTVIKCPLFPYLNGSDISKSKKIASEIPLDMIKEIWDIPPRFKERLDKFERIRI
jgi:Fe-S-cluster containining protein